ncbi:MAG: protein TonB [Hyphococcus sp.]|nr:MAG: protein TonB [Marinicaulis sp.]
MGSLIRLLLGVPGAVVVTGLLFLFMAAMIRQDLDLAEEEDAVNISITAQLQDSDLSANAADIKRPTLDTPPPPPPAVTDPTNRPTLDGAQVQVPKIDANLSIGPGFNPDRDAQPLVRIPPQFPERCKAATGGDTVLLQFDVTPEGQTANIEVVDSTNRCFNRAASRSVERWKYQPKIVDNKAEWRRGVRTTIRFQPPAD